MKCVRATGREMAVIHLLTLMICCCVVEVNSQTVPYVSFMGQTLADHSYVDLSLVGRDRTGSNSVQCHTDLDTCCSDMQGSHRGDWYFPNGNRLRFSGDIFEQRRDRRVELRRKNSATSSVGIYRCDIPTDAVHIDDDRSVRDAPVYVGLYTGRGGVFCEALRNFGCKMWNTYREVLVVLSNNSCSHRLRHYTV